MAVAGASTLFLASSSQYLLGDNTALTSSIMSVGMWLKNTSKVNGYPGGSFHPTDNERYYPLYANADADTFTSIARYDSSPWLTSSTTTPVNGTWYFVFADYDLLNSRTIYVNAVFEATGPTNTAALPDSGFTRQGIGALTRSTPVAFYDGSVCDPQIYNTTLTAAEQQEIIYNPSAYPGDLVFWLDMRVPDDAVGNYKDLSGSGANMDTATLPSVSADGPPVHLFAGGM